MFTTLINTYTLSDNFADRASIDIEEPRMCMHCKNTGDQKYITGCGTLGKTDKVRGGICIFACKFCGSNTLHFMEVLQKKDYFSVSDEDENEYFLRSVETIPSRIMYTVEIPEAIIDISSDFYKIYNEAIAAEEHGLSSISGMAYRKAVEFLVTDYLLKLSIDGVSDEWLKNPKTSLSNKINKIPNESIKNLSKAISFIGNDETHYTRRHPEHDINSIKLFIKALLSYMENEIIMSEAEKLLNKQS